jgi:ABC-type lipoprotein release transport system permease subunit
MGILVISPTHYEGLMWVILYFVLLCILPILYNFFNTHHKYIDTIPMQNSLLQTSSFIIFMMSLYCAASMLPCGRYYYEPEGGYVGNP